MAETTSAPNNKPVTFKGDRTDREPAGVANTAPMKPAKGMRKKAKSAIKRGMISPKAAAKHLKDY